MNIRNNKKTSTWVLAGLATGAAAYYLFGTENGKRTCDQLMSSVKGMSDTVANKASDTFANLKNKANNMM
ncbi:YtxH domain-containing protein [Pedobacter sp. SYSU D00535]|uniref:YtxH domain-containing protein n=1 Tax=Pedobacter sp. SYSU D00535 TaxID=2810308 RepID=UPI001A96758F|nr:YtxH domain-containing protein [Pedobacter sp. SYSU D00535]